MPGNWGGKGVQTRGSHLAGVQRGDQLQNRRHGVREAAREPRHLGEGNDTVRLENVVPRSGKERAAEGPCSTCSGTCPRGPWKCVYSHTHVYG